MGLSVPSVILVPYRPLAVLRRTERGVPDPDKEDYELADASSRSALDKQERQSAIKHCVRPATVLHLRTRLGHSRTARV